MKGLLTVGLLGLLSLSAAVGCANNGNEPDEATAAPLSGMVPAENLTFEPEPPEPAPKGVDVGSLRKAIEEDPSDFESHRRLGIVLRRSGEEDKGLVYLEKAAELAPDNVEPLLSLGIAYSRMGRLAEAETTYKRIVELDPSHAKAINNLGNIALRQGQELQATALYRRAVEADPEYLLAMHRLAGVLKYYGQFEEAYPLYEKILEFEPSFPAEESAIVDSLYNLGWINLSWKNYELAEEQLTRVVRGTPHHRSAHYARAQALIQLGRHEESQRELELHMRILIASGEGY